MRSAAGALVILTVSASAAAQVDDRTLPPTAAAPAREPEVRVGFGLAKPYIDEEVHRTIVASSRVRIDDVFSFEPALSRTWGSFATDWAFGSRFRYDSGPLYGWVGPHVLRRRERFHDFEHTYLGFDVGLGIRLRRSRAFLASEISGGGVTVGPGYVIPSGRTISRRRFEVTAAGGPTAPLYEQLDLRYGPVTPEPPNVVFQQGVFQFFNSGSTAVGVAASWMPRGRIGAEVRLDRFHLGLLEPGSEYAAQTREGALRLVRRNLGTVRIEQRTLNALSLNGRYWRGERLALLLSGGLSYVGATGYAFEAPVGLGGVTGIDENGARIELETVTLRAAESPGFGLHRFGVNAGTGVRLVLIGPASFVLDGRLFLLPRRTLPWTNASGPPDQRQLELVRQSGLPPVRLAPRAFNVTMGLALGF